MRKINCLLIFQQDAMSKTRKSVSVTDVERFEKWMNEYGSC